MLTEFTKWTVRSNSYFLPNSNLRCKCVTYSAGHWRDIYS